MRIGCQHGLFWLVLTSEWLDLYLHVREKEDERAFWGSLHKGTNPSHESSTFVT